MIDKTKTKKHPLNILRTTRIFNSWREFFWPSMCTTAEPSIILASTVWTVSDDDAMNSKQLIKSDLFVQYIMPFDANTGGQG